MIYDLDLHITRPDQWQTELKKMLQIMASSNVHSVRLAVPNFELKTHIKNLLSKTGFEHVCVNVSHPQEDAIPSAVDYLNITRSIAAQ